MIPTKLLNLVTLSDVGHAFHLGEHPHTECGQVLYDLLVERGVTLMTPTYPERKLPKLTRRWLVWLSLQAIEPHSHMRTPVTVGMVLGVRDLHHFYTTGKILPPMWENPWWVRDLTNVLRGPTPMYNASQVPYGMSTYYAGLRVQLLVGMCKKHVLGTEFPDIDWVQNILPES